METTLETPEWSHLHKISFRFFFIFLGLYFFPFPLDQIIPIGYNPIPDLWELLVGFVGNNIMGFEETLELKQTGSGDKLYNWIHNGTILGLSIIGCIVWTVLDWSKKNYDKLNKWFLLLLAYYLAYFMFSYGIIKLYYLQFRPPSLSRLYQTYGQASPMNLMWTFMGFSKTYTVFAGFSETIAGVLLIFRRTRVLGGLVAFAVMLNVFMMNMSYDIPVKLLSFQLAIMGLFIGLQNYKQFLNFFVFNKSTTPIDQVIPNVSFDNPFKVLLKIPSFISGTVPFLPFLKNNRGKVILFLCQALFVFSTVSSLVESSAMRNEKYGENRVQPPLYGIYNVDSFVINSDTLPPLTTDTTRWKRLLIDYPGYYGQSATFMRMKGKPKYYAAEIDTIEQRLILNVRNDTVNKYELFYSLEGEQMTIQGVLAEDTLDVKLTNYPLENFGLINRGFHWVNEVPFNRYNYE